MDSDIRALVEGTADASVAASWAEDFQAGRAIDRDAVRAWVLPRFEAVARLASPEVPPARRHAAVFALGCTGDPRAVRPMLDVLVAHRHWNDHDFVEMAFAHLGPAVLPALLAELPSRNALRTRAALTCLGHLPDVPLDVWREVGEAYADEAELYVAVFNQHRADLLPVARLGLDRPAVRIHALGALSECARVAIEAGQAAALDRGLADDVARGLDPTGHRADRDPDASSWAFALQVLAALEDPRAVTAAVRALDDPQSHAGSAHAAIEALGWVRSASAMARLRTALRAKDPELQGQAAEAIGLEDPEVQQTVLDLVAGLRVDGPGWWHAVTLIGRLPDGARTLRDWVDPAHPRARRSRSAIHALAELSDPDFGDPERLDGLSTAGRKLVEEVQARRRR